VGGLVRADEIDAHDVVASVGEGEGGGAADAASGAGDEGDGVVHEIS
jgi:hypothetical protein